MALLTLNWWERCCSRIFIANRFRFEAVRMGWAGVSSSAAHVVPAASFACMTTENTTGLRASPPSHPFHTTPSSGACSPPHCSHQERADDEHTTRGMRLVQAEIDAMSKGWPLGDGIALFGLGSYVGGSTSGGPKRGSQADLSVELNASSSAVAGGAGSSAASGSRPALFGSGTGAAGSDAGRSSPPSKAALMREKYANRSSSSMAGAAAGPVSASAAPAPPAAPDRQQRRQQLEHDEAVVDALFAGVESRPSRQTARLLDDQHIDSSVGGYLSSWKGMRR